MAQFCGKWELISTDDNFDKYMEAVGVSEENRKLAQQVLVSSKVVQDISQDGSTWIVKVDTPKGEKVDKYPEGKPVPIQTLDGRDVTVTYTLEGDKLIEHQKGNGFESRNVRTVTNGTLVFTASCGDKSCKRVYKRIS